MFTGIIHKTSRVIGIATGPGFQRLTLETDWDNIRLGESIAVNGVCLTAAEYRPGEVGFDVVPETLSRTNLGLLRPNDHVHIERALRIGDAVDGHFVQGHVDGTARLLETITAGGEFRLKLQAPPELARYLTPKGSVTIDGVSLTLAAVDGPRFELALIPTTLQLTLLGRRPDNWIYNLECDVLSKTVVSWLERTYGSAEDRRGRHDGTEARRHEGK